MSPAHVLEPTYDALRRRLVAGDWPPGYRLEAMRLADELGVSITPVRDALNRLTGERLVESEPGEGFRVPRLDGGDLRTTFAWHHRLMTIAMRWRTGKLLAIEIPQGHGGIGERTALLFGSIAATAGNAELNRAVSQAAARLNPYRKEEATVFTDVADELAEMEQLARGPARSPLVNAIGRYHDRRELAADRLAHLPKDE
ncbi:winged helix-turn-helix domain-containing protein [uncultured Sphingomonas sp.]|uniref:GntR family transcriptional regulator n=1 Tax=uncultured Sphingomonas sp. TaxID=158754 RepID=UPI002606B0CB|nr:winged helix-turn-helix domain-containing protein [uncultured Sphingomonas sp.]